VASHDTSDPEGSREIDPRRLLLLLATDGSNEQAEGSYVVPDHSVDDDPSAHGFAGACSPPETCRIHARRSAPFAAASHAGADSTVSAIAQRKWLVTFGTEV